MFKQLFVNFTILLSAVSLTAQALREREFSTSSSLSRKLLFGAWGGLVGITLMLFSIQVTPTVIVDFRNIAALWSAIYGGPIAALVTCFIIGSFRVFNFGITTSSIIGFITIMLMGIGYSFICHFTTKITKRYILCTIFNLVLSYIAFSVIITDKVILKSTFLSYLLGIVIVSYFLYLLVEYHRRINLIYRKYKAESQEDFLTGLNNVRVFDKELNTAIQEAKMSGEIISLLFLDIDHFKNINDNYGHIEGDLVLKELGNLLHKTCRDRDIVSRNGGEEFSVILRNCSLKEALEVSERLKREIQKRPFKLSGNQVINITVSIGIASYPETTKDIDKLTEQADNALYEAKRAGRNKVAVIDNNDFPYTLHS